MTAQCHCYCYYYCVVLTDVLSPDILGIYQMKCPSPKQKPIKTTLEWRNWNLHTLLVDMYDGAATLEDSLAVSQKGEHSYQVIQQFHSWV